MVEKRLSLISNAMIKITHKIIRDYNCRRCGTLRKILLVARLG
jgi:hypothetical protein